MMLLNNEAIEAPDRCPASRQNQRQIRRLDRRTGLTLTELLVVIAILVVVTSILAPLITPSLEGREIREATRQINAYVQQAQAKARELGRTVGVVIRRSDFVGDPNSLLITNDPVQARQDFGYQLSLAEEPPPFRGFLPTDRAHITAQTVPFAYLELGAAASGGLDPAIFKLIQPNDFVRFNLRGDRYRILGVGRLNSTEQANFPNATFKLRIELQAAAGTELGLLRGPVPFEVFRRPKPIASSPLELPTGTALVMDLSGVGMDYVAGSQTGTLNTGEEGQMTDSGSGAINPRQQFIGLTEFKRPSGVEMQVADPTGSYLNFPLTIMFSPDGTVDRIYRVLPPPLDLGKADRRFPPKRPQDKVYLFVGKDGIGTWANFKDTSNLWITIDPITGLVTSAPHQGLVVLDPTSPLLANPDTFDQLPMPQKLAFIARSRQLAATGQSMGGQ